MITTINSATLIGIHACTVSVEIDARKGLPSEHIVGLPDAVIKESKCRIKAAIKNSGFSYPIKQYTINLAPADLPKEGATFDLPIAVGLLVCNGELDVPPDTYFIGELSLDGHLRPIKGVLSICEMVAKTKAKQLVIPFENKEEAALLSHVVLFPIRHLSELSTLNFSKKPTFKSLKPTALPHPFNYCDIKGQHLGKRAMEIAAAGMHNILLIGPPGSGKTMLIQRLPSIITHLTEQEAIESLKTHSIATPHSPQKTLTLNRPYRAPHHTISHAGLVGGGKKPLPGEISLAHHGILFLDELPEFNRQALEALRQPLEMGEVTISRSNQSITYPAKFLLSASMNPCPCGYATDPLVECTCSGFDIKRYQKKLSGPLLDRFDIILEIPRLKKDDFTNSKTPETSSEDMRTRVLQAVKRNKDRARQLPLRQQNMPPSLNVEQKHILGNQIEAGTLTARSCNNVINVARTIADLENSDLILNKHLYEALFFRYKFK